jgi:Fe2+ transport system protein FeoA/rubredoxin
MKCSLCGYEFSDTEGQGSCANCPMHKGCSLVRCPNCGFETPKDPLWAKKFLHDESGNVITLDKLEVNCKAKVTRIKTDDEVRLKKLMAMGIFPGMEINLVQKYPSFVFTIGYSQFAVDLELAREIFVKSEV